MKRSEIREHVFRMLFCYDFHREEEMDEQAQMYLDHVEQLKDKDRTYLHGRFLAAEKKVAELDRKIEEVSTGWKLNRMGKAELTIIRLAAFEIFHDEEVPASVAINEAVELAKRYGEENSGSFVNGILAKLVA